MDFIEQLDETSSALCHADIVDIAPLFRSYAEICWLFVYTCQRLMEDFSLIAGT